MLLTQYRSLAPCAEKSAASPPSSFASRPAPNDVLLTTHIGLVVEKTSIPRPPIMYERLFMIRMGGIDPEPSTIIPSPSACRPDPSKPPPTTLSRTNVWKPGARSYQAVLPP